MKKLMIGLVGACALCVSAEVESGNVVGFDTRAMTYNANLCASMFDEIGLAGMDIQKIIPESEEMYGGGATFKLLTSALGDKNEYYYLPADEAPDGVAGWYDEDWETYVEKTFDPGEGFILVNNFDSATKTIAGEVLPGKPTWELGYNANISGNITPIDLQIQDIAVGTAVDENGNLTDVNEEVYGGAFTFKLLTSALGDLIEFYYLPESEAPDGKAGWYHEDWETFADETFEPGEGFVLINNLESGWVQIPAAITK